MRSLVLRPEPPAPAPPGPRRTGPDWVPWQYRLVALASIGVAALYLLLAATLLALGRAASTSPDQLAVLLGHLSSGAAPVFAVIGLAWLVTALGLRRGRVWGLAGTVVLLLLQILAAIAAVAAGWSSATQLLRIAHSVLMLAALLAGSRQPAAARRHPEPGARVPSRGSDPVPSQTEPAER